MLDINEAKAEILNRISQEKGGPTMSFGDSINPQAKFIQPGRRIVYTISSLRGGMAERLMREIAYPQNNTNPTYNQRSFGEWRRLGEIEVCDGHVLTEGHVFPLTLKIGVEEGLVLRNSVGATRSLKNRQRDVLTLEIGVSISDHWIPGLANQIIGTWVTHGQNWINRSGKLCNQPYGHDSTRPLEFAFQLHNGARSGMTLGDLIEVGGIRSAHAGQWNRPYTFVPAACGMPIILHEFKQTSDDIARFRDYPITAEDSNVWGPYCRWNSSKHTLGDKVNTEFQYLALQCVSPFAFHLHATRALFPNCTLASTFILKSIGEARLYELLRTTVLEEADRFYRLIDEDGLSCYLRKTKGGALLFENEQKISPLAAIESVMQTFSELERMEEDPGYQLSRSSRIVLDSHFYVVAFSLAHATPCGSSAYHLSGSEMYRYMNEGQDAEAHIQRNDRLFQLLQSHFLGIQDKFAFHLFPPISLEGVNQYSFNPGEFDRNKWLAYTF